MKTFLRKLRWLKQRRRKEEELNEELQFHLSEKTEQRQAEGLAGKTALRAARLDLGNHTLLQEDCVPLGVGPFGNNWCRTFVTRCAP